MDLGPNKGVTARGPSSQEANMKQTDAVGPSQSAGYLFHPAQVLDETEGKDCATVGRPSVEDASYRLEEGKSVFSREADRHGLQDVMKSVLRSTSTQNDMLPGVEVAFKNLTMDIPIPGDGPVRRVFKKCLKRPPRHATVRRVLSLEGIFATFYPGDCVAILGSSGAGKTTFLNVLSGRVTRNVGGRVYFNGAHSTPEIVRALSCFIQQDCFFFGNLTVREHLRYQAGLRLPPSAEPKQHERAVQATIDRVGLSKCADRRIGNIQGGQSAGISGGEQRRLAVASELLTHPCVIFADEPTSGLDSYMALQVGLLLRSLADAGRTVIATIHQPSTSAFALFNKVVLLAEGLLLYCGPREAAAMWFTQLGETCAPDMNPAEFLISVAAVHDASRAVDIQRLQSYAESWRKGGTAFLRYWEEHGRARSLSQRTSIERSMALQEDSGTQERRHTEVQPQEGKTLQVEQRQAEAKAQLQEQQQAKQTKETLQQETPQSAQRKKTSEEQEETPPPPHGGGGQGGPHNSTAGSNNGKRNREEGIDGGESESAALLQPPQQEEEKQNEEKRGENAAAAAAHRLLEGTDDEEQELASLLYATAAARSSRLLRGCSPEHLRLQSSSLSRQTDACAAVVSALQKDRIGIFAEMWLHFQRSLLLSSRDPFVTYGRILQSLVAALIPAFLYFRLSWNGPHAYNKVSASFYTVLGQAMSALFGTTFSFQAERPFIQREYESGAVRMPCYYIGRVTADSLIWCISPFVYHTVTYWILNLGGGSAEKYFASFAVVLLSVQCIISYTYMVVSGIQNPAVAMAVLQVMQVLLIVFSGFMLRLDRVGKFWVWLMYLSPLKYALNCFTVTIFRGAMVTIGDGYHLKGTQFLSDSFGFDESEFWLDIGLLFVLTAGARLIGMITLTLSAVRTKENE